MTPARADLQIRPASLADLPEMLRIAESVPELPQWSPSTFRTFFDSPPSMLRRDVLAGVVDGQVAGFGVLSLLLAGHPIEGEIETLAVGPQWRRCGIGRAVLLGMIAVARTYAAESVHLEVRAGNTAALALYHATGFAITGRRHRYYQAPVEDAVLLNVHLNGVPDTATASGMIED